MENVMKLSHGLVLAAAVLMLPSLGRSQVAGSVAPDKSISYAIVGAGGFLGVARHDVAVPVGQLKQDQGRLVWPGATMDALKAAPAFEYAPQR
jgi:hypothetical protein